MPAPKRTKAATDAPLLLRQAAAAVRAARVVCPHDDADGLASAAVALRVRGQSADAALLLPRGHNPFRPGFTPPPGDGALDKPVAVLDQGVRDVPYPVVFVDHHAPEVPPADFQTPTRVVVSGFGEDNVSTSVLMARLFPDPAHAWLAAVGAAGDYGDAGLKRPECAGVVKSHVKTLVPLINAPRRVPGAAAVRAALAILIEHDSPKAALADPRMSVLEDARHQWRAAYDAAVRTAPNISNGVRNGGHDQDAGKGGVTGRVAAGIGPTAGPAAAGIGVALIRFRSDCQVHPLVAQAWSRRLAPKAVIAANDDYVPGHTNFAMRGGPAGVDLRDVLKRALPDAVRPGVEFAHGHPQATGGSLPTADFDRLVRALGF